jgi:hypothetical protein
LPNKFKEKQMMPQDMPHDDAAQDADQTRDIIGEVLRKVADEMDSMHTNGIMERAGHPMAMKAKVDVAMPDKSAQDMPGPETGMSDDSDSSDLDPEVLSQLMDKAGQADDSGALPEDHEDDLPPELSALVKAKKRPM